ncbi:ATP-dependent zinc metalloprotease FTSH, chloroplastic [Coccomyxa sp. Obi]|nr:ATP-dependent zinc metalloprotease FTSH, chloroplastic [Coccomyxa sp. Obi]
MPEERRGDPWRSVAAGALLLCAAALSWAAPSHARARSQEDTAAAIIEAERPGVLEPSEGASTSYSSRVRDTGIQLAAADTSTDRWTEYQNEKRRAMEKYATEKQKRRIFAPKKKGKKVDVTESLVQDPAAWDNVKVQPQTAWRVDRMKNMTYTQFWQLVKERRVDKVKYTSDKRSVWVTTNEKAPGGVRTEKVGLPYDPDLFDHMVEHGVHIEAEPLNQFDKVIMSFIRLFFPIWFAYLMIMVAFRIGVKKKRDRIFGGAKLDLISKSDKQLTFKDIEGIDQVKAEIRELVEFLKNPKRFIELGARSPAGVLLVGAPGTGKTLLAKAIAGEAGVPFFSAAGTEFMEVFVGVGASRVRDMFQKARKAAPCILFIDEFDGIGQQRSSTAMGNDESVQTINQLLTEMDGFEDNSGVIVMAATNRPAALDTALTRPGRFDRIIHLPLPNLQGRIGILKVHSRNKKIEEDLDYHKVARATAGFTGAELMNLMNTAAVVAVRRGAKIITEADVFQALENIHREKMGRGSTASQYDEDIVPPVLRKTIAVYEAGRVLLGYITPGYDEISQVSVCPGGVPTGYTYFIPQEEHLESRVVTRGYMEARMVVGIAGRCAERLVLGEANITTAGGGDLDNVNNIAREMVYRCGFSKRLGPVALMDTEEVFIGKGRTRAVANIGTELAAIALTDIEELVEGAEAKAFYGLAVNYKPLQALVERLLVKETLSGKEVAETLEDAGVVKFPDAFVEGFAWGPNGGLVYPGMPEEAASTGDKAQWPTSPASGNGTSNGATNGAMPDYMRNPLNPYRVRVDLPDLLCEELRKL